MRRSPMPEEKKKLARIPLPPKPAEEIHGDVSTLAAGVNTGTSLAEGSVDRAARCVGTRFFGDIGYRRMFGSF